MDKVLVGKHHEKRGEDTLTVYKSKDGDVILVEQYDALAAYSKLRDITLWAESVPALVKLLQKAAGVKEAQVEYEYALQSKGMSGDWREISDPFRRSGGDPVVWADKESREELAEWCRKEMGPDFRVVKRRKAGPVKNA